jgi:hypothetical protein
LGDIGGVFYFENCDRVERRRGGKETLSIRRKGDGLEGGARAFEARAIAPKCEARAQIDRLYDIGIGESYVQRFFALTQHHRRWVRAGRDGVALYF